MIKFIQRLEGRYRNVLQVATANGEKKTVSDCRNILKQLALAETSLQKQQIETADVPLNLVVFGPTQAGKSTLVNCLLPEPMAGVSPLAGYTVHPQAFATGQQSADFAWLDSLLSGFNRRDQNQLDSTDYNAYSVTELTQPSPISKQALLTWDTPDFDSVDSRGYIDGVLRTIGLADILILIASKEKYADQSVWNMLELLAPLKLPLLICINKLAEGEEQTLFHSFQQRYQTQLANAQPPQLISMPFVETDESLNPMPLIEMVSAMIAAIDAKANAYRSQQFIQANWQHWLQPIHDENEDEQQWQAHLQQAIKEQLQIYRHEYLDQPDHYDTFQRTLAELLELLELPGFGQTLGQARDVITWPVRKLVDFGKSIAQSKPAEGDDVRDRDYETALLTQLADQLITQLAKESLDQPTDDESYIKSWEQGFRRSLNQSRQRINDQFEQQISDYQNSFEEEIQQAAQELYVRLADQPLLLNSLRAARVTTDAAAVVLTLHAGGISVNDFILAPAMLSLSSMLTESSLGQYINTVKARLRTQQYETVEKLLTTHLQSKLLKLREQSAENGRFQISEQTLKEVEGELSK